MSVILKKVKYNSIVHGVEGEIALANINASNGVIPTFVSIHTPITLYRGNSAQRSHRREINDAVVVTGCRHSLPSLCSFYGGMRIQTQGT